MRSPDHSIISLFTGAGGLDLGFEAAGYRTRVAVEIEANCVETIRTNREWPVVDRDLALVSSCELLDTAGLSEGEADVLIGGPPCQPFSKSGYWARGDAARLQDPRAETLTGYLRVLRDTLPRAFLLENVAGLAYSGKSEGLEYLRRAVAEINDETGTRYSFEVGKLNAANFGVPQDRERVFVIGARDGVRFSFPVPTHGPEPPSDPAQPELDLPPPTESYLTAWDSIGDLDTDDFNSDPDLRVGGKWAELLPSIPEGDNYLWHTARGGGLPLFGWRRRYWSFLLKLSKRRPSWTITADPGSAIGPFHWKSRRLATRELCRLQTLPDSYAISGSRRSAQRQLGNAVPSALAERLALEIRQQLLGDAILDPSLTLLPSKRLDCPPAEPATQVPRKYHHLVGIHSAHPGTGQGYGARRRREGSVPAPLKAPGSFVETA